MLIGSDAFTLEAVAREAGVARVTVYDRFGGREALVEAISDDLAESGGLTRLPEAFGLTDPVAALERFVEIFCGFYSTHRLLLRRLHAMAVLGRNALGTSERDPRRLQGSACCSVASRGPGARAPLIPTLLHTLHVLTGFAFIDAFAGADAEPIDVAPRRGCPRQAGCES